MVLSRGTQSQRAHRRGFGIAPAGGNFWYESTVETNNAMYEVRSRLRQTKGRDEVPNMMEVWGYRIHQSSTKHSEKYVPVDIPARSPTVLALVSTAAGTCVPRNLENLKVGIFGQTS